ncbi:MAG: hypothetical protein LBF97_02815 [Elusimicrobiota bacterium]|jgi:hypothetical protein|nr:hypothetical protein [Elusimicrobiota bacterium]
MSQVLFDSITANSKFQNVPDLLYGQFEEDGKSYTIGVANAVNPEFKILSIQLTYAVVDSD